MRFDYRAHRLHSLNKHDKLIGYLFGDLTINTISASDQDLNAKASSNPHSTKLTMTQTLEAWSVLLDQSRVYEAAIRTELQSAPILSSRLGTEVFLKREDQQPVFSFKLRGAYNCIAQLCVADRPRGVVCASAGNHAQGVAMSAAKLSLPAVIVMPVTTPEIKVAAVRRFGGEWVTVELVGDNFDAAKNYAIALAETQGFTFIPPYDNAQVIAGQASCGTEIADELIDADYVFVPTGGGGLLAGVALALAIRGAKTQVIAVEPEGAACFKAALEGRERVKLESVDLFVDGVAVAQIGELNFAATQIKTAAGKSLVNQVITCTSDEVCAAIKDFFDETRCIAEPAAALAISGLKTFVKQQTQAGVDMSDKKLVAIISGANMNFDRLRYIAERTEIGEDKESVFAAEISEQKGAFLHFCRLLKGLEITEFNYRYQPFADLKSLPARVFFGLKIRPEERAELLSELEDAQIKVHDLTHDELAQNHVRHLIGGQVCLSNERMFSAEFPEKPGALLNFLSNLGAEFNITLFHYRNHGAADGRVLFGVEISEEQRADFTHRMERTGYVYEEVTDHPAIRLFL